MNLLIVRGCHHVRLSRATEEDRAVSDIIRAAISEHIENIRRDPKFQTDLEARLDRARRLLDRQLDRNPVIRGASRRTPEGHVIRTRRGLCPLPGRVPRIPDDTQWLELLRVLRPRCVRDRLMFVLAYDGALRRIELAGLWLSDIDFSARTMTIRQEASKTGVQRTVPYSATSSLLLREYLPHRRVVAGRVPHLFVSESPRNRGGSLSGYTWGRLASELADQARLPFFSTHTLRHLRLTDLARAGFDIKELALFAGHRSFDSTLTYIHLSGRDMSCAFQRASGNMPDRVELL